LNEACYNVLCQCTQVHFLLLSHSIVQWMVKCGFNKDGVWWWCVVDGDGLGGQWWSGQWWCVVGGDGVSWMVMVCGGRWWCVVGSDGYCSCQTTFFLTL
jgi:hypothetical protein